MEVLVVCPHMQAALETCRYGRPFGSRGLGGGTYWSKELLVARSEVSGFAEMRRIDEGCMTSAQYDTITCIDH